MPTFKQVGDLGKVGVAEDHVQPAVLLGVAVRLVAGVDDRPLQSRLEAHLLLEEVGPLGELELDPAPRPPSLPTLPAPVKICRVTKWGMACWTTRANGTALSIR